VTAPIETPPQATPPVAERSQPEPVAAPTVPRAVTLQQLRDAWPEILEIVQKAKRTAWMVVYTSTPRKLDGDVLTLSFPSETDVTNFKDRPPSGDSVSELLRSAITTVLGIRVKYVARVDAAPASGGSAAAAAASAAAPAAVADAPAPSAPRLRRDPARPRDRPCR
jgi:DNA polymerase-3 subunit gamma/tau